mmetsp:Transcript_22461/g.55855  ORF Transcript_22461/g.55855 Transcript_22461/m.55855 type:complete len:181 (-) Transcript_22461:101-643(-)
MIEANAERARWTMLNVLATCVIAVCVNGCSYGLIGRTSPTTFQVVGHTKTCLVLTGGFILWPLDDSAQMLRNIIGLSIAMVGCILYGHLKLAESAEQLDVLDRCCPSCIHGTLLLHKRPEAASNDVQQDDKEPFFPRVQQGVQLHTDASIALRRVPTGAESHSCTFSDVSGTDEFEKRGK